jgi:16S rRNA (cytidine1402-2'-O)-methyltransferase
MSRSDEGGRLVLVATPIGNLGDLSPRAVEALSTADLWIVEDTRVSGKLASYLQLSKPMRVLNDHTSDGQVDRLLEETRSANVALLTDGGTPVVSDPGARLVDRCIDAQIAVSSIPGPSAPMMALCLSGFYAQRFAFLGFLGRKPKDIKGELRPFENSPYTLVLFESPHRIEALLQGAAEVLGDRRYAICREMTKAFEQTFRSRLPSLPTEAQVPRKGEFTVVIEGLRKKLPNLSER